MGWDGLSEGHFAQHPSEAEYRIYLIQINSKEVDVRLESYPRRSTKWIQDTGTGPRRKRETQQMDFLMMQVIHWSNDSDNSRN